MDTTQVFIINYNRLTTTAKMVDYLLTVPNCRPVVVDNNSTYPPLLEWYKSCPVEVIRLSTNDGKLSPWLNKIIDRVQEEYYVVTDSDLDLSGIPIDLLEVCREGFNRFNLRKVGLGLRIDDIPAHFALKQDFIDYQSRYWLNPLDDLFFAAHIDTTFAMYRSDVNYLEGGWSTQNALRTNEPYLARHTPWYIDLKNLTEEELYYWSNCSSTSHSRDLYLETIGRSSIINLPITGNLTILDFDDFEDCSTRYKQLFELKRLIPELKVTLFCIPSKTSEDNLAVLQSHDWISPAVHGWDHSFLECRTWTYERTIEVLDECERRGYDKIFRAPHWETSPGLYAGLVERNWICADHHKNIIKRPRELCVYDTDNKSAHSGVRTIAHGHLSPNARNGIVEKWDYFTKLKGEFTLIRELFE